MKNILFILTFSFSCITFGIIPPGSQTKNTNYTQEQFNTRAAACQPSTEFIFMDFNNVRALIEVSGSMWQNRTVSPRVAAYYVPKPESGTGPSSIYAGALWMGGKDVNGQLKLAAHLFRQGTDFWPGPLEKLTNVGNYNPTSQISGSQNIVRNNGAATIGDAQCVTYDRFWTISKSEVVEFNAVYESIWNPNVEDLTIEPAVLNKIVNWPAHPFESGLGQDRYLAPFYDRNGDGIYQPDFEQGHGDYPWYDLFGDIDCKDDRRVVLFGDFTHWWVFNDRGNIHSESEGDPIGFEVRAQAFAFATSDEINNMTFYNYEIINRGTQTLEETFFSQFVDADLGGSADDLVGCDVSRGLSFCYNGDDFDDNIGAAIGYGNQPPAVGIDFFEGPYQDNDGIDNPGPIFDTTQKKWIVPSVSEAISLKGIVYNGIGIGYGDGVIDNERFGMRRFTYFNGSHAGGISGINDDPDNAVDFYRYMTGYWKNGSHMKFGGNGVPSFPNVTSINCDYMFPGDSDSLNWGTAGVNPGFEWMDSDYGDRRFVQSAGPFTLKPGAVNNITVGVVWARASSGGAFESVNKLKEADTKAQALFDACFRIVEPPQAPKLVIQELENELVLYLSNPITSNNYKEQYKLEDDLNIPPGEDKFYRFEGYHIYQLSDGDVNVSDIGNLEKARLVAQCDIKNDYGQLVNWVLNEQTGVLNSEIKTFPNSGNNIRLNEGIRHSFRITEDQFATGDKELINHKTYYYTAIAYGVNQYKLFEPGLSLGGQQRPFLPSRLSFDGSNILSISAIPHSSTPEKDGTFVLSSYGETPRVTRIEGTGNGGNFLNLTGSTIEKIIKDDIVSFPTYEGGSGPINVKIIDPLNVVRGYFLLKMNNASSKKYHEGDVNWKLYRYDKKGGLLLDSISSERTIKIANEQLIPEWGIAVDIEQKSWICLNNSSTECNANDRIFNPIGATVTFLDSSKLWLTGLRDTDTYFPTNWILSGQDNADCNNNVPANQNPCAYKDTRYDLKENYETLLQGTVAPFILVNNNNQLQGTVFGGNTFFNASLSSTVKDESKLYKITSFDLVYTPDKSKWTRACVIESGKNKSATQGGSEFLELRNAPSVDKNGLSAGQKGYNASEGDLVSNKGMGWFPGYAIDIQTGERLNIVFSENSIYTKGRDMIFNPTSEIVDPSGNPIFGEGHNVYVFRTGKSTHNLNSDDDGDQSVIPNYSDRGKWIYDKLAEKSNSSYSDLWKMCSWVLRPMLAPNRKLLSTEVTIKVRVNDDYNRMIVNNENNGYPIYEWNMNPEATVTDSKNALVEALEQINIVPNPYYGYSQYERSRIDNRVKIVNIPERCNIKIFNVRGKLIREFDKDNPLTSIDWDLKNEKGIPISSGLYIIYVDVPGIGEKVLKWFGALREPDLQNL